jgi:hypothetical protein
MFSNTNNRNPNTTNIQLTNDQRFLIDMYTEQYNQAQRQIALLNQSCNNIRSLISNVYSRASSRDDTFTNDIINLITQVYVRPATNNIDNNDRLTEGQIIAGTRIRLFSEIEEPINRECPIRLQEFQQADIVTQIRNCGHIFNSQEIQTWFLTSSRCPVCRTSVRLLPVADSSNNVLTDLSNNNVQTRRTNNTPSTRIRNRYGAPLEMQSIDSSGNIVYYTQYF